MFQPSTLTQIITTIPAILFWGFFSLSSGLLLLLAIIESIHFFVRKDRWIQYFNYWRQWLSSFLWLTLASWVGLLAVLAINWSNLFLKVPFIISPVSVGCEIFVILVAAILLYLMQKKRERFSAKNHLIVTWLSGLFFNLTLWWPVAISAWAECPLGTLVNSNDMTLSYSNLSWVVLSPLAALKFFHMMTSCWVVGATFFTSICCVNYLRNQALEKDKTCIFIGITVTFLSLVLTMCIGDSTGYTVAKQQPMKMATIQDIEKGGKQMPFTLFGPITFSNMLSRLSTHSNFGFVPGKEDVVNGGYALPEGGMAKSFQEKHDLALQAFKTRHGINDERQEQQFRYESQYLGYASLNSPSQTKLSSDIFFWAFRIMIGTGFFLLLLLGSLIYALISNTSTWSNRILRVNILTFPLALCCTLCGWFIAEFGKYPWAITDFITVSDVLPHYPTFIYYAELILVILLSIALIFFSIRKNKI